MNEINWTNKAVRQLRKIHTSDSKAIFEKVGDLAQFPNTANTLKLTDHKYTYRLRVGNYRVFFEFDGGIKVVTIEEVKKRDNRTY